MSIGFQCSASSKPSSAIYNWQATFSVTVKFHFSSQQFLAIFFFFLTFPFSYFDRAKEILVLPLIQVKSIYSLKQFEIQIVNGKNV
jgi:hypothetical protein